ncbi:hypothetical protein GCM10023094_22690 [Rhodococcus olei]|uniref:DUF1707 domain-containing protein n=1 Tax=Rhodococcus olei TaxID=2161675 RepID=A0ABP8P2R2_9NOCA
MAEPPEIRIGTVERERALDQLTQHFSEGRLTVTEFDERSGWITTATTRGELERVFTDLPAPTAGTPAIPESPAPQRHFSIDWSGRIMAVIPLLALVLFFVTGSWLWFLAIPAAGVLLFGTDRERTDRRRRRHRDDDGGDR